MFFFFMCGAWFYWLERDLTGGGRENGEGVFFCLFLKGGSGFACFCLLAGVT